MKPWSSMVQTSFLIKYIKSEINTSFEQNDKKWIYLHY